MLVTRARFCYIWFMKYSRKICVRTSPPTLVSAIHFQVQCQQRTTTARLETRFDVEAITTRDMPFVVPFLRQTLPEVLDTKCFNPKKLPFIKEVANTEVAHLFEHVILSLLCNEKCRSGVTGAHFRGETRWNWYKYPRGTFQIDLSVTEKESSLLQTVLPRAIEIVDGLLEMKLVMNTTKDRQVTLPVPLVKE